MRTWFALFMALLTSIVLSTAAKAEDKVVYHVDDAAVQATKALRNIRNQLDESPDTAVTVVAHADGVKFLMEGAKDPKNPDVDYQALVNALKARGVRFEVCEVTMKRLGLKKDQFIMEADFTPSGVVRITQLQNRQGYAYMKP